MFLSVFHFMLLLEGTCSPGTYQANGSGRDWFFVGDYEYRNGRRTPQPNSFGAPPERPPAERDTHRFEL